MGMHVCVHRSVVGNEDFIGITHNVRLESCIYMHLRDHNGQRCNFRSHKTYARALLHYPHIHTTATFLSLQVPVDYIPSCRV